ncbi:MAG TPA: LuxR C-terminal-related transcriptional regulator [Symbiobacteriaceae bacterium]|nr:LuxR C-terminal-related transcriptional regulator [Symbiobacteriaceae bacterium]
MLPIANTKLHAPQTSPSVIFRQRLLERLDEGLAAGRRLTLVEAPAGYGKTTLLTTWLHRAGRPFSWVSLDAGDNEPSRLAACLIAALRKVAGPDLCQSTESVLRLPQPVTVDTLAAYLAGDLDALTEPVILVLDDYHVIEDQQVHRLVQTLLDRRPPTLHLVIATRSDPPLTVARWRARADVTEIRAGELRFTGGEAGEFLRRTMRVELPDEEVAALETRTEGWAAGLQLAGLSLQGRDPAAMRTFVESFSGSHRYILDYLAEEVLREQPPAMRDFLCQTALLDRLTAPLCDAVTGRTDSRSVLTALEQANLFLVPLDDHREWYRYHHLFRDVLRLELTEAEKLPVHRRGAEWLEANGQAYEAVTHYLAGREPAEAARVIKQNAEALLVQGDVRTLLAWLSLMPAGEVEADPELGVYRLWGLFSSGQLAVAATHLPQVASQITEDAPRRLRGRLACIQAWITLFSFDPAAVEFARAAMQLVDESDPIARCATVMVWGNILSQADARMSEPYYREAYDLARRLNQPFMATTALMDVVMLLNTYGRRREAEALVAEGLREYSDREGRPLPVAGAVVIQYAMLLYDAGQMDKARQLAQTGLDLCRSIGFYNHVLADAVVVLARVRVAEGDVEGALALVRQAKDEIARAGVATAFQTVQRLEAEIQVGCGDLEPVVRWVESLEPARPEAPWHDMPFLTMSRLLTAQGRGAEVPALLEPLEAEVRRVGAIRRLITIQVLKALATGDAAFMEEAVALAEPQGYVRLFLDEGPGVVKLLQAVRETAPAFIEQLIGPEAPRRGAAVTVGPGEHLTERELELLRLVAGGLSNEEIAAKLFISVTTAKWHIRNVFEKLGVHSRTQAAAKARELNLV